MREERLIVRPFEELQILDFQSIQVINEHAKAKVKGRIPFEKRKDYIDRGRHEKWAQIIALTEQGESILFYGIIEQIQMEIDNGICTVGLSLCSGTQLMDYTEHIRSFQGKNLSYHHLLDICSREYDEAGKIMTVGNEKPIPHFIMQYKETDWEFIKRLAAMNHTVIFADCSTKGEKYHFGLPERKFDLKEIPSEYRIKYDMQEYWIKKSYGLSIQTEDTISYLWESREVHKLGEKMSLDGKEVYIWKIESSFKGNELYHTCYMKMRPGFQTIPYYNKQIAGNSLLGEVIKVKNEDVQIKIYADENKQQSGACWYSFSTIYSSADGTGWYCMPEIGDVVRLYFPTEKEENAYVSSAYHEKNTERRTHPECKFWRNKEGKEIQLSPEHILLTNNEGTYIELSDDEGVKIVSEGSVTVHAGESLNITSSTSSIELSAPKRIRLKQGNTEMNLGGDLKMRGARIKL